MAFKYFMNLMFYRETDAYMFDIITYNSEMDYIRGDGIITQTIYLLFE
jgi:hypothetical protein